MCHGWTQKLSLCCPWADSQIPQRVNVLWVLSPGCSKLVSVLSVSSNRITANMEMQNYPFIDNEAKIMLWEPVTFTHKVFEASCLRCSQATYFQTSLHCNFKSKCLHGKNRFSCVKLWTRWVSLLVACTKMISLWYSYHSSTHVPT